MKKVLFIDHPYHIKTQSTKFFIDYLKEHYEVEIVYDNSHSGESTIDLSIINDTYHAIIFFQMLPSKNDIRKVTHNNIVCVPMYDNGQAFFGLDYHWKYFKHTKIINFSKTLDQKHKKMGFDTLYVQYFPPTPKFIAGDKHNVFFWQRLSNININTVETLLANYPANIFFHRAIDPKEQFTQPSKTQEQKYNIKYSDWFEHKEDLEKIIALCAIYIAPRYEEGFGKSYLEAMSMGKIVIAHNEPAMNEYIIDGKTGFLRDFKNPSAVDFTKLEEIQKASYEYCKEGRSIWERNLHSIIDFIDAPKNIFFNIRVSINALLYIVCIKIPRKIIKILLGIDLIRKWKNK